MTKPRLLISLFAGTVLLVLLALILPRYLHLDNYKPAILAELQKQLNRQVRYDTSEVSLGLGAVFTFNKVEISEPDQSAPFLSAKRLRVTVAIMPLLHGKLVLRDLTLDQPEAAILRFPNGTFNISDLLQEKPGREPLHLHTFNLNNGTIRFTDQAITPTGVTTTLAATDLSLSALGPGKKGSIRLKTTLKWAGETGDLSLNGKYELPKKGLPLTAAKLDVKLSAHGLDAAHTWPYYHPHVPFRQLLGQLDLETTLVGQLANFSAKGKASVTGLRLDYQPVFHALLQPKTLRFSYQLEVSPQAVNVKTIDLLMDGLRVKGNCLISGIDSKDPRITTSATTSPIDLAKFNAYIPYGIISKEVADYIEQHIKGGILHLDNGRLDGTVSQIVNMGVGTNYNVLFISAHIENGIVSYGPAVPTFNAVKGRLELKGKDFILSGMSGKFGTSPLTMEGRITDYPPTATPCAFPFNLHIAPNQTEISWLLGPELGKRFTLSGNAPLVLTGEGTTAQYLLTGNWQLLQATYGISDLIKKPLGKNSSLTFKVGITPNELLVHSASYNLGPLFLSLAGKRQFSPGPAALALSLGTNRFAAQELALLLPTLLGYHPEGSVQATLTAQGSALDPKKLSWRGPVRLSGFGFKPNDRTKPLRGINGTINLNDSSIETAQLSAAIGSTQISGKGRYQWGDSPTWSINCSSPKISPADFGFTTSGAGPTIAGVHGVVSGSNDQITIKHLSGQINKSTVTVRGALSLQDPPTATLSITSPHLELADLAALGKLDAAPRAVNAPPTKPWQLSAAVVADTGTIGGLAFTRLHAQTELKDSILYLQPYEFQAYGGKVSGKSRLDFGAVAPRYQISCAATNIDVGHLLTDFGAKDHKLTGAMSMSAELTSKGNSVVEWKKSALGSAKLKISEGSINRFPVLSKVFSILNVSQLLKLQLPDMVSGGMPFNELSATFAVADGTLSTKNLYLASDAMNLSAVGSVNLPKNEISATIGVQPLQTIDKVVSRIPIVGWILTGKDKTLISTYFEAKGRVEDPVVTAIPVKSMTKGTLDIFKRIFTLPAKLITDTGEVLLNN